MTKRLLGVAAFASLFIATASGAQSPYDILRQDIVVTIDPGGRPHITTTVEIRATEALRAAYVLTTGFPTTRVRVGGTEIPLRADPRAMGRAALLDFPTTIEAGATATYEIEMEGLPTCAVAGTQVCATRADELVLLPPSTGGPVWHVFGLYGLDTWTGSVTVTAPIDMEVVAGQGRGIIVELGATRRWSFAITHPVEMLSLWARRAARVRSPSGRFHVLGPAASADPMTHAALLGDRALGIYESTFGAATALDEVHMTSASGAWPFGGMGLYGNVMVFDGMFEPRFAYLLEQGTLHELAHTWWAGVASAPPGDTIEGGLIQEGLAEYSAWRVVGELEGERARMSGVRANSVWYMFGRPRNRDAAPLTLDASDSLAVFLVYHKASSFFRMVEARVGADPFASALRRFLARGAGGLTVDALERDVIEETGVDVQSMVDEYFGHAGFPTIDVGGTRTDDGVAITANVDSSFHLTVPIRVTTTNGETRDVPFALSPGEQQASLGVSSATGAIIEVDPMWTALRRLRPVLREDTTLDGEVDGADVVDVALRMGSALPTERRVDGRYDPFYDVDENRRVDRGDVVRVLAAATADR